MDVNFAKCTCLVNAVAEGCYQLSGASVCTMSHSSTPTGVLIHSMRDMATLMHMICLMTARSEACHVSAGDGPVRGGGCMLSVAFILGVLTGDCSAADVAAGRGLCHVN